MWESESPGSGPPATGRVQGPSEPGGLLDALGVAAVVLDADGRICLWSPGAERLFGYSAAEALGRSGVGLLIDPEHAALAERLFREVLAGRPWAGVFPIRHADGSVRQVEFRDIGLRDSHHRRYGLAIATERERLRALETDLALTRRVVGQSPTGLAVYDRDLRYVMVNPALERINGFPAEECVGRRVSEVLPYLDCQTIESEMRQVLETGRPLLDRPVSGLTPADQESEHTWSVSYYRLEDARGRVLGLVSSVVDVTERHRAAVEATRDRQRLAAIADATMRIGTTLDLDRTAAELADTAVAGPAGLADAATVQVVEAVLTGQDPGRPAGPVRLRTLARAAGYPAAARAAAALPGTGTEPAGTGPAARCAAQGRPVLVSGIDRPDGPDHATGAEERWYDEVAGPGTTRGLRRAGVHSYLAVPLIARGCVLGALSLLRSRNPRRFEPDDVLLANELAARAAVCLDNARWYRNERATALALQHSLLPRRPPPRPGLEIACRYRPAEAAGEIGGDWYDVLPLPGDRTALVIGDVMGSGVQAAAAMGQLRTATRTLARLRLDPAEVMRHLDRTTAGLESSFATCAYVVFDPRSGDCDVCVSGHLPPVLVRPGGAAELLDTPTGAPLGVGGVPFATVRVRLDPDCRLVLYTDGLVETRSDPIDARLRTLTDLLARTDRPLEQTCDLLLDRLRDPGSHDDAALLIAARRVPDEPPVPAAVPAA